MYTGTHISELLTETHEWMSKIDSWLPFRRDGKVSDGQVCFLKHTVIQYSARSSQLYRHVQNLERMSPHQEVSLSCHSIAWSSGQASHRHCPAAAQMCNWTPASKTAHVSPRYQTPQSVHCSSGHHWIGEACRMDLTADSTNKHQTRMNSSDAPVSKHHVIKVQWGYSKSPGILDPATTYKWVVISTVL